MQISAKVEYAMRGLLTLTERGGATTADELAAAQKLPAKFLGAILNDLRRAGILASQRGSAGGYRLARSADTITCAEVMRALDGPLAAIRGMSPEEARYDGAATNLQELWVAVRASLRQVLENVTLEDVYTGNFPSVIRELTQDPGSWMTRIRN